MIMKEMQITFVHPNAFIVLRTHILQPYEKIATLARAETTEEMFSRS